MKKTYKLTKEESQILRDFEAGKFVTVKDPGFDPVEVARNTILRNQKNKNINIRLSERDLVRLKEKANANGLPYQTLVTTLLHQYVEGKIELKL